MVFKTPTNTLQHGVQKSYKHTTINVFGAIHPKQDASAKIANKNARTADNRPHYVPQLPTTPHQ